MNNNAHNIIDIPKETLELLPWFVTGKLSLDDKAGRNKSPMREMVTMN